MTAILSGWSPCRRHPCSVEHADRVRGFRELAALWEERAERETGGYEADLAMSEFTGWRMSQDVVWQKRHGSNLSADRFRRVHEHAVHWYQGAWGDVHHDTPRTALTGPLRGGAHRQGQPAHLGAVGTNFWVDDGTRLMTSVIEVASMWRKGGIHPTEKPYGILAPLIEYAVPVGGLVLDPFAGSASTLLTARQLGRHAIGIEASEEYCERAAKRLAVTDLFSGGAA